MNPKDQGKKDDDNDGKPPPIPRRHNNAVSMYQQSPYGTGYGAGAFGSVYGSPHQSMMYSSPGGYGGYPSYGMRNLGSDTFSIGLEDVTSSSFQSMGNVIQAFSSVSMMLESTLFATQNSVRAIASVADQFRNLRLHLISSGLSFIKSIRYYIRKLLVIFRMRKSTYNEDTLWEDACQGSSGENRHWGMMLLFVVVFGTPWIIWKLLRQDSSRDGLNSDWHKGAGEHFLAEVKFSFTAENSDELSITQGDVIRIAPKHKQPRIRGWILASDGENKGIVPSNYVNVLGINRSATKRMGSSIGDTNIAAAAARELPQRSFQDNEPTDEFLSKIYDGSSSR